MVHQGPSSIIIVVGTNKIVKTYDDAVQRVRVPFLLFACCFFLFSRVSLFLRTFCLVRCLAVSHFVFRVCCAVVSVSIADGVSAHQNSVQRVRRIICQLLRYIAVCVFCSSVFCSSVLVFQVSHSMLCSCFSCFVCFVLRRLCTRPVCTVGSAWQNPRCVFERRLRILIQMTARRDFECLTFAF